MKADRAFDQIRRQWTEAEFAAQLATQASTRGWERAHPESVTMKARGGRTINKTPMPRGWPDEAWHRRGWILLVELKDERNGPDDHQRRRLSRLAGYTPDDRWGSRGTIPTGAVVAGYNVTLEGSPADYPTGGRYVALWRPRHWHHAIHTFDTLGT